MRTSLLPYTFSFVWPAAILLLLFSLPSFRRPVQARRGGWFAAMIVLAIGIVLSPVGGIPLGRWFTGLCANFSLPLLALIASAIGRLVFKADLLGKNGTRTALGFGLIVGGAVYPMVLGLGHYDPYSAGWSFSWLFAGTGALAALLLWYGNRFGLVLLAAIAAYHLGLLESDNYWDYLMDPVYAVISLLAVILQGVRACWRRSPVPVARG